MEHGKLKNNSPRVLGRLASLTRLSLKWYLVAAVLLFIGVGLGGELFFRHNQTAELVNWRGPWWCLCALSATNLMILPLTALVEGCDQVDWAARSRLFQNVCKSSVLIGGMLMGFGLYAPALSILCALTIYVILFGSKWRALLTQVITFPIVEKISWTKEILPMQWRIALSWASGYFIFSLFNPLLFSYAGPKVAGQFGMTWAVLSAISNISQSFVNTRAPRFAALIARNEILELRKLWRSALLQAVLSSFISGLIFVFIIEILTYTGNPLVGRMVGLSVVVLFCVSNLMNQVVFTIAVVARAEKREPFLLVSVVVAFFTAVASFILVRPLGALGLALSFLVGTFISFVWSYFIYLKTPLTRIY